jgi:hypothetical protein
MRRALHTSCEGGLYSPLSHEVEPVSATIDGSST